MNYEELVKALRIHASVDIECYECAYYDDCCINGNGHTKMMTDAAAAIEALQAQLPKRGEWEVKGANRVDCSVCGHSICFAFGLSEGSLTGYNYCPNCGAKMEVQE